MSNLEIRNLELMNKVDILNSRNADLRAEYDALKADSVEDMRIMQAKLESQSALLATLQNEKSDLIERIRNLESTIEKQDSRKPLDIITVISSPSVEVSAPRKRELSNSMAF